MDTAQLEAGVELDVLVARVLGLRKGEWHPDMKPQVQDRPFVFHEGDERDFKQWLILPAYSTDLNAAFEATEKVGLSFEVLNGKSVKLDDGYHAKFSESVESYRELPAAICRAILALKESEE